MSRRLALAALLLAACSSSRSAKPPADAAPVPSVASQEAKAEVPPSKLPAEEPAPIPAADCPVHAIDGEAAERTLDRLLDQAEASFDDQRLAEAYTCADQASDLAPDSVEAHHLRAAALAALGHDREAELAYQMALALDPDDPETLRAVADFYLNIREARDRDTAGLALELARRGRARATARRRGSAGLRADLALLMAQAENDLGRSDEALDDAKEALRLNPQLVDAIHERGVALFDLGRFQDARAAFTEVLGQLPDDAYAHHFLGLVLEQLGMQADAEAHFQRARELAPDDFPAPVILSPEDFQAEVDKDVAALPPETRAELVGVPISVVDFPARDDLDAVDPPFPPNILGLYRGLPAGVEQPLPPGQKEVARAILLYRVNLGRAVRSREELSEQIERTLLHEIGHLEGLDEDDLRRRNLD